jgi:hypothetical protein
MIPLGTMKRLREQIADRQRLLAKLDQAVQLICEIGQSGFAETLRIPPGVLVSDCRLYGKAPLEIVRDAVVSFGDHAFDLNALCGRVAEMYPDANMSRGTISRRLYDLRCRSASAIVAVVEKPAETKQQSRFRKYSYCGPPGRERCLSGQPPERSQAG